MKFARKNTLYLACTQATLLMASGAQLAYAEETAIAQASPDQVIEEIVVEGYRGSLLKALQRKRESNHIMDAIMAEDIGKTPDQNVAEAMQRISGVTISRDQGEGSKIYIRGMDPDYNQVSINGATLTSGGDDRSATFDSFSSQLFSAIEVHKTPQASHAEGSLGGRVNLKTNRGLDKEGPQLTVSAKASYNDLAEETDPLLTIIGSQSFADNTFGVLIGLNYEEKNVRQDTEEPLGWIYNHALISSDIANVTPDNYLDINEDGVIDDEDLVWTPDKTNARLYTEQRDRVGANLSLQWQPSDETDIYLDLSYSKLERSWERWQINTAFNFKAKTPNNKNKFTQDSRYLREDLDYTFSDDVLVGGSISNGSPDFNQIESTLETTNFLGSLGFSHRIDNLLIRANVYSGESTQKRPDFFKFQSTLISYSERNSKNKVVDKWQVTPHAYSVTGDYMQWDFGEGGREDGATDITNADEYQLASYTLSDRNVVDTEDAAVLDLDWDVEGGWVKVISTGLRASTREKDRYDADLRSSKIRYIDEDGDLVTENLNVPLNSVDDDGNPVFGTNPFPVSNFLDGEVQSVADGWVNVDFDDALDFVADQYPDGEIPEFAINYGGTYVIEEKARSGYIMLNFDNDDRVRGNLGVRVVSTEVTSNAYHIIDDVAVPVSIENNYNNVLPSFNLAYSITDQLLGRVAISRAMARPKMSDLSPGAKYSETDDRIVTGNPWLNPMVADQVDLSLEWYFAEDGLLGATFFAKNIKDFIYKAEIVNEAGVTIKSPVNGDEAEVRGLELNYQQHFSKLPSPFDGLGSILNYTYIDSDADYKSENPILGDLKLPMTGLSEHAYNIIVYYEKYGINARLAYNFRGEHLKTPSKGKGQAPSWQADFGTLDLSLGYKFNGQWSATFTAQNMTDEHLIEYFNNDSSMLSLNDWNGRRYQLGVRYKY
ncbi:MAG: TonB-dependent receptor [Pseudomonadales bacterium]